MFHDKVFHILPQKSSASSPSLFAITKLNNWNFPVCYQGVKSTFTNIEKQGSFIIFQQWWYRLGPLQIPFKNA